MAESGEPDPRFTALADEFETRGYVVVDLDVTSDVLDAAVSDMAVFLRGEESAPGVSVEPGRVQDGWRVSGAVRSLALDAGILELLGALYGRAPLPFQTLNFPVGTEQRPHADAIHFSTKPAGFMCGVWVALEDIDRDNGPLIYYPGSQRLGEISIADIERDGYLADGLPELPKHRQLLRRARGQTPHPDWFGMCYQRYLEYLMDKVDEHGFEPEYGLLKKGQALVWASDLFHGGAPQNDPQRTRHSQVTHYFFEGCEYYTPLTSYRGKLAMRDPEWIR